MYWAVGLLYALGGLGIAAACSFLPGLHAANVAAFLLPLASGAKILPPEGVAFVLVGMASGYAMLHTVPGIFCALPDEESLLVVLPGQKYLLAGRGPEAVALCALGGLGGAAVLLLLAPLAPLFLPRLYGLLQPHFHWVLWAIVAYLLLSEWPRDAGRTPAGLPRLWAAWKPLLAGLATFLLAGLLGLVLSYRPFMPLWCRPAGLTPAFIGLFGLPWLLQGLVSRRPLPQQHPLHTLELRPGEWLWGTLVGAAGGLFAALFPAVTGGVGALLAGQSAGQRHPRAFLVSQGACRMAYTLGSLLLFFVPTMGKVKGVWSGLLSTVYTEPSPRVGCLALGAAVLCSALAFLLSLEMGRFLARMPVRRMQQASLLLLVALLGATSGPAGLFVGAVATAIGLIPALWGSRRLNTLGVVLLPIALNLSGLGERWAAWLGLL